MWFQREIKRLDKKKVANLFFFIFSAIRIHQQRIGQCETGIPRWQLHVSSWLARWISSFHNYARSESESSRHTSQQLDHCIELEHLQTDFKRKRRCLPKVWVHWWLIRRRGRDWKAIPENSEKSTNSRTFRCTELLNENEVRIPILGSRRAAYL